MRKPSISQLVYNTLFPKPRANDPTNFASHITRNLVPEVRVETSTFYGTLDCIEAQYPGLDYSFPPHRMRLNRFYHHRKLFLAFDILGLTEDEIASLCRWEGTRSAKERYEREEGIQVKDTTTDGIMISPPHRPAVALVHRWQEEEKPVYARQIALEDILDPRNSDLAHGEVTVEEESSDDELEESVGLSLNRHLREATAARERGSNVPFDDDWEQWFKDAIDRGSYQDLLHTTREGSLDFGRALTSPTGLYGSIPDARQARHRAMPAPGPALVPGLSQYRAPGPPTRPPESSR